MIHLGGFGGYVTFRFDHTVANGEGADFKILGNTFAGSSEPGIIMVAWDKNKMASLMKMSGMKLRAVSILKILLLKTIVSPTINQMNLKLR